LSQQLIALVEESVRRHNLILPEEACRAKSTWRAGACQFRGDL
jgi:hypothetical protein